MVEIYSYIHRCRVAWLQLAHFNLFSAKSCDALVHVLFMSRVQMDLMPINVVMLHGPAFVQ